MIVADVTPPFNTTIQKKTMETINATNMKLAELQWIYNFTTDLEIRHNLSECMIALNKILYDKDSKVKKLKCQAEY